MGTTTAVITGMRGSALAHVVQTSSDVGMVQDVLMPAGNVMGMMTVMMLLMKLIVHATPPLTGSAPTVVVSPPSGDVTVTTIVEMFLMRRTVPQFTLASVV